MPSAPLGVFDSGVGGLTVLSEIMHRLPHEDVIYLADAARIPYGGRSSEEIIATNN
ncbi:MAG: glutamate racemase, partial [Candidatus Margulisbacteria bacterium]|nr:glutamate racemase [Candidatus Margulisiibacteriota bacterium]